MSSPPIPLSRSLRTGQARREGGDAGDGCGEARWVEDHLPRLCFDLVGSSFILQSCPSTPRPEDLWPVAA